MAIILRPNQIAAVTAMREAMKKYRRLIVCAPTGYGKRVLMVWCCIEAAKRNKRSLIVTDRRILVRQAADECREHGVDYGIIMANEPENSKAPVQIASVQTLKRREWRCLPEADVCWIDEAHKEGAAYAELMRRLPDAYFVGLTATPVGAGGTSLCY